MKKYIFLCIIIIAVLSQSVSAAKRAKAGKGDSGFLVRNNVKIGIGLIGHYFLVDDDYREGGNFGIPGDDDTIEYVYGINVYPEIRLNKIVPIKSNFEYYAGYRLEYMTGGYKYTFGSGGTMERKVNILNNILYCAISRPLDNDKYTYIGVLGGVGPSRYEMDIETSSSTLGDYNKSIWGLVMPAGAFIDWGGIGIGARFGIEMLYSIYEKEDGVRPQSTGVRLYLNLRYAFF